MLFTQKLADDTFTNDMNNDFLETKLKLQQLLGQRRFLFCNTNYQAICYVSLRVHSASHHCSQVLEEKRAKKWILNDHSHDTFFFIKI